MAIVDLYSKRQKRLRGEVPDVYTYDEIPDPLRVQILHIWENALGTETNYKNAIRGGTYPTGPFRGYKWIVRTLCQEYGVLGLFGMDPDNGYRRERDRNYCKELHEHLFQEANTDRVLDAIELSFRVVDQLVRSFGYWNTYDGETYATIAINELNARFREHGIGYAFESGQIVRIDSQLIHSEVVKPVLHLLSTSRFKGAQDEFLSAHDHYRKGNHKEALIDALKAIESTLKAICDGRSWSYGKDKATAKQLIDICFKKNLIPEFWQSSMSGLRSILEGGVPTARNRLAGHGQGTGPVEVPEYVAAYVLHLTASTIIFLVKADEGMK